MKLCINADDYGYTWGVTEGILFGHLNGIITSTTVLTNSADLDVAYQKSLECPNLGFGVHLTLTLGKPLTEGKTLSDENGNFFDQKTVKSKTFDSQEVEAEFRAQIEKFIEIFKRKPDHLDSHHSVHDLPQTIEITKKLMKEYGLKARRLSDIKFVSGFYGSQATVDNLINILEENKQEESIEIMTHPAYSDSKLRKMSSYNDNRVIELQVLCDQRLKDYIKLNHIELIHY